MHWVQQLESHHVRAQLLLGPPGIQGLYPDQGLQDTDPTRQNVQGHCADAEVEVRGIELEMITVMIALETPVVVHR